MNWRPGMAARVIDIDDLKMPGKGKAPFAVGDPVRINKVMQGGNYLQTSAHPGWFHARRFEPL